MRRRRTRVAPTCPAMPQHWNTTRGKRTTPKAPFVRTNPRFRLNHIGDNASFREKYMDIPEESCGFHKGRDLNRYVQEEKAEECFASAPTTPRSCLPSEHKNEARAPWKERSSPNPTSKAKTDSRKNNLLFRKVEVKPHKKRKRSSLTKLLESMGESGWIPKMSTASPPRGARQHDHLLRLKVVFDTPSRPNVFVACRGPKSVEQVIEAALLIHAKSGNPPKLPVELNRYELRRTDSDDKVDENSSALHSYRDVHTYNLNSVGLCRKKMSRSRSKWIKRPSEVQRKIAPGCLPLNIKIHKTKACHTFGVLPETSVDEVLSMLNALKQEYNFSKENYALYPDTFNDETIEWGTKVRDLKVITLEIRPLPETIEMEVYKEFKLNYSMANEIVRRNKMKARLQLVSHKVATGVLDFFRRTRLS